MLYVCESPPPINVWMPKPAFMKIGMYVLVPEPIWTAYIINASHKSVCLYVYVVRRQRGKNITAARNTHTTIAELLDASFSIWSVSYQRRVCGCVCVSLSFLGNGSLNTFPRQRIIVRGLVFYALYVVSKESRRFVLPRTFWFPSWREICCL
jgi:hypothetical protein